MHIYNEFFSRNNRRHPVWKSESEYKAYLSLQYGGGNVLDKLKIAFDETEKYLRKNSDGWIINDDVIKKIEEELNKIKNSKPEDIGEKNHKKQLNSKETILKLMKCMSSYAKSVDCECDFIILKASQFFSGFNKNEFGKIPIVFQSKKTDNKFTFAEVVSTLSSSNESKDDFFYLYFKPNKKGKEFDKEEFCKRLYQTFM